MNTHFVTDLPDNARSVVAGLLNARLADALDLRLSVKQAHWNIRGPGFIGVHEMLDGVAARMDGHVDTIAERVVQLGGVAAGTLREVAKASTLSPYPVDATTIPAHLGSLHDRLSAFTKGCRRGIEESLGVNDAVTADILTGVSRAVDKDLWMVAANLG
jgi:starvation-inducible DNA-binding protein